MISKIPIPFNKTNKSFPQHRIHSKIKSFSNASQVPNKPQNNEFLVIIWNDINTLKAHGNQPRGVSENALDKKDTMIFTNRTMAN